MENIEITNAEKDVVVLLAKLQILTIRYVQRHNNLYCRTLRDVDRVVMKNKFRVTYKEAYDNLNEVIETYCPEAEILKAAMKILGQNIENNAIKNLRFGLNYKATPKESALDLLYTRRQFYMLNEMVDLKNASEILGLSISQMKQACQEERLMNTEKIGGNWVVHLGECRAYWNIPDEDDNHLYKDYQY